jgi:hypothetical protein
VKQKSEGKLARKKSREIAKCERESETVKRYSEGKLGREKDVDSNK